MKSGKPKRKQKRAVNKKVAFLSAFKACGSLTDSAAAVGINRSMHYDWLAEPNGKYAAAFEQARIEAVQTLVDAAVTRALKGVYEPNVYQGKFIYPMELYEKEPAVPASDWKDENATPAKPAVMAWRPVPGAPPLGVWKRSEMLHLALLRAWVPEFRQQSSVELTGKDGADLIPPAINVTFVDPEPDPSGADPRTDHAGDHSGSVPPEKPVPLPAETL